MDQAQQTDILHAAASLFSVFTFEKLVPLLMIFSMSLLFIWVLYKAQGRDDFDAHSRWENHRPGGWSRSYRQFADRQWQDCRNRSAFRFRRQNH